MVSGDFSSEGDGFGKNAVVADLVFDGGVMLREGCYISDQYVEDRASGPDVLTVLPEMEFVGGKAKWNIIVE